jgi:hypothetical protein
MAKYKPRPLPKVPQKFGRPTMVGRAIDHHETPRHVGFTLKDRGADEEGLFLPLPHLETFLTEP